MNRGKLLVALLLTGTTLAWAEPETPLAEPMVAQATPAPEAAVPEDKNAQAEQALNEGRELYRKGFSESAIVQYRKAIELNPELVPAYQELGKILMDTKNQAFAITIYQKLAQLQPEEMKWKEILFDLHTAYEMPREAAAVGEEILLRRPEDVAFIKRLAEVYKGYGLQDKYADTLVKGAKLSNNAQMYYEAGEAYLAADMKSQAVEAYQQAAAIEPSNLEYQNAVGKGLNAAGDSEAARAHYDKISKQFPQATGLRDRQAETEIALGDRMLSNRRYVAARKSFEKAKELLGNTSSDSGLGASIQERIDKANRLNHVYLEQPFQLGNQGDNFFSETQTVIGIPMHDDDLAFQIINDVRHANAPGRGRMTIDSVQAGLTYKAGENTEFFARGGTFGIFRVGVNHQDDKITAGLNIRRDLVSYTPDALRDRLHYWGADGNLAYQFNDLFSLGGAFAVYRYGDGISEYTYNIGPRFTPINRPNDFIWALGYNHGGVFNQRDANPLQRFGPTNFQIDSFGTDIEHWLSDAFRYRLGYYRSISNVGVNGNTFLAGFDYQVSEGSYIWLNYEYGNFLAGRVAPGLFSNNASNYILNGGLHVTF